MNSVVEILLYLILLSVLGVFTTIIAAFIGVPAGCRLYIKDTRHNGKSDPAGSILSAVILLVKLLAPIGLLILISALRQSGNTGMIPTLFVSSLFTVLLLITTIANTTEKLIFEVPHSIWDTGLSTGATKGKIMKSLILPNIRQSITRELIKLFPISLFLLFVASMVVQNRIGELITSSLTNRDYLPLIMTVAVIFLYNYICIKISDPRNQKDHI